MPHRSPLQEAAPTSGGENQKTQDRRLTHETDCVVDFAAQTGTVSVVWPGLCPKQLELLRISIHSSRRHFRVRVLHAQVPSRNRGANTILLRIDGSPGLPRAQSRRCRLDHGRFSGPSGHRQGRRLLRSGHATKKSACSLNQTSPFGQAGTLVYRVSKGERADDQSRHRYSAVFVHGRFRNWNRNRRCDLPDLAGQSATPLLVRACWYVDVKRDTRDARCANVFRADFSCA